MYVSLFTINKKKYKKLQLNMKHIHVIKYKKRSIKTER